MERLVELACACVCLAALSLTSVAAAQQVGATRQAVIIGEDGRRELHEIAEPLRSMLEGAVVALLYPHRLELPNEDEALLRAPAAQEALGLCEGEAFAHQPSAALCTGVLIDDDLVATAGHCLGDTAEAARARCGELRVAFGYAQEASDEAVELEGKDVFACRRVVLWERARGDYAVFQLERSAAVERTPLTVAERPVARGAKVTVASTGAGLPLKVELGARVTAEQVAPDFFAADTDTFAGGSGGAVLDAQGELVGLVARGSPDFVADGACRRAARQRAGREQHQHALSIRDALCEHAWPSSRLCGTQPACGDDVCSASESPGNCARDCAVTRCGDTLCERSERQECAEDCHAYDAVDPSWPDDPAPLRASVSDDGLRSQACSAYPLAHGRRGPLGWAWFIPCFIVAVRPQTRARETARR